MSKKKTFFIGAKTATIFEDQDGTPKLIETYLTFNHTDVDWINWYKTPLKEEMNIHGAKTQTSALIYALALSIHQNKDVFDKDEHLEYIIQKLKATQEKPLFK